jgi:hypothetical protein
MQAYELEHLNIDISWPIIIKIKMLTNQNIFIKHYIYPNITAHHLQFTMDKKIVLNCEHTKLCIKT